MDLEQMKRGIQPLIDRCDSYLKDSEDLSEDDVKTKLIEPLFRVLGWDFEDVKHVKEQVNQPSGRPDYVFYNEGRIAFFLEAKKLKEISEKDKRQAYNYALHKSKRWAVLTNFKETYILICDNKGKTIQDHIYTQLTYHDYPKYIDNLTQLSRESISSGLLDERARVSGRLRTQTQIDDELLEDITEWRRKLTTSIRANNSTDYDKQTLTDMVQTILDRIVFIRTAEDRKKEAVKDRTLSELLSEYRNNSEMNLKNRLNSLFESYDKVYDSKLFTYDERSFKDRHECEKVKIDNRTLSTILSGTYLKGETIEYNFADIDADVLGSVYENYLGFVQERRNKMGIFYTPVPVVQHVIKNALERTLGGKKPKQVDRIRVVDPACGSGSFLIKAFDFMNSYYHANDPESYRQKLLGEGDQHSKRREDTILENNLFGVDLDEKACDVTKLNLLLKAMEDETSTPHRLPNLQNVRQGNSLIDNVSISASAFDWNIQFRSVYETCGGFDCVVGNPPWGGSLESGEKKYFHDKFLISPKNLNTFDLFVREAHRLVRDDGIVGFVIPHNSTKSVDYRELRSFVLENFEVLDLKFFGKFPKVTQEFVTITLRKRKPKSTHKVLVSDAADKVRSVRQSLWQKDPNRVFNPFAEEFEGLFARVENVKFPTFDDLGYSIRRGEELSKKGEVFYCDGCSKWFAASKEETVACEHCGKHKRLDAYTKYNLISRSKSSEHNRRIIDGSSITPYQVENANYYDGSKRGIETKPPETYSGLKVVLKKIETSFVASANHDDLTTQNVYCIKNEDEEMCWFLLALLNSKMWRLYYQKRINLDATLTTAIPIEFIRALRIPSIDLRIVSLAKEISQLGQRLGNMPATTEKQLTKEEFLSKQEQINKQVYHIYGLAPDEIKAINDSTSI